MSPRKLSPPILAALGLSACVDGCDPADLPLVGVLFDHGANPETDGGHDGEGMQACLNMVVPPDPIGPCLEAPQLGPCLEIALPPPIVKPIPVGPCLRMAPSPAPLPPHPSPKDGSVRPHRTDVLASLVDDGVLASDVLDRLPR